MGWNLGEGGWNRIPGNGLESLDSALRTLPQAGAVQVSVQGQELGLAPTHSVAFISVFLQRSSYKAAVGDAPVPVELEIPLGIRDTAPGGGMCLWDAPSQPTAPGSGCLGQGGSADTKPFPCSPLRSALPFLGWSENKQMFPESWADLETIN